MCQKKYFDLDEFKNMVDFQNPEIKMTFPILEWYDIGNNQLWDKNHSEEKDLFNEAIKYNPFKELAFNSNKENMYKTINSKIIQGNYWGVDIPVLLGDKNNDTIFIIGESPTRNKKDFKDNGGLVIGTPFAVACKKGVPKQCDIYKYIFNRLTNKGYCVYITDAVKVWYDGMKEKGFKNYINTAFLEEEIGKINPTIIVAWGKTAEEAYNKINSKEGIDYLHQTHPGTQKWDYWEKEMYKDSLQDKEPKKTVGYEYANNNEGDRAQYLAYFISQQILDKLARSR